MNPSVVDQGCAEAKVYTRTGKRLDTIIKGMWQHLKAKDRNKSSAGFDNFDAVETSVLKNWAELKKTFPTFPVKDEALAVPVNPEPTSASTSGMSARQAEGQTQAEAGWAINSASLYQHLVQDCCPLPG